MCVACIFVLKRKHIIVIMQIAAYNTYHLSDLEDNLSLHVRLLDREDYLVYAPLPLSRALCPSVYNH
jgi:hypothetical protein